MINGGEEGQAECKFSGAKINIMITFSAVYSGMC